MIWRVLGWRKEAEAGKIYVLSSGGRERDGTGGFGSFQFFRLLVEYSGVLFWLLIIWRMILFWVWDQGLMIL
jgi:hypothetical protein